jgi:signal transduction histidine kinase
MRAIPAKVGVSKRNVRQRLLLLILALLVTFIAALAALAVYQQQQGIHMLQARQDELGQLFKRLVQLRSVPLQTFVYDYSSSDAMVRFVESGDSNWATVNIEPPMRTFRVESVWIYRPDFSVVYYGAQRNPLSMWEIPAVKMHGAEMFHGRRYVHFYTYGPRGIWAVCGAMIRLRTGPEQDSYANGYLIAAVCLQGEAINEFSTLLGGAVTSIPTLTVEAVSRRLGEGTLVSFVRLPTWDESTLAYLEARVPVPVIAHMRQAAVTQVFLGAALATGLLVLVAWALRAWVSQPLRAVAAGLDTGDPSALGQMEERSDEFGHVARLIRRFHQQRGELVREVAQRQQAEADLRRSLEFERLVTGISTRFVSEITKGFDAAVKEALARIGEFADVDRSYVFQFSADMATLSCSHEWCRQGVAPAIERLQGLSAGAIPWNFPLHQRGEVVMVHRLDDLPPEAATLRAELEIESTQSILCVPMVFGKLVLGFVGFGMVRSERQWTDKSVSLLRLAGDIFANALQHERSESQRSGLEEQLRHARQIESLGRLAGGVAHDLNNLLVPVMGYSDVLRDALPEDDALRADVAQIRRAAEQARGLTQQLLAFARRQVLNVQVIDLCEDLAAFRDILRRLIPENIELAIHTESGTGRICADLTQVRQILVNLALNARDAMPKGGTLAIAVANADLDERYVAAHPEARPGEYVMLTVSDTGMGMDQSTLGHMFEPFYTTKEAGKGTGLGLATVHGVVVQHGGHIAVFSVLGEGTTVRVYLPRAAATANAASAVAVAPSPRPDVPATVLVVEDAEGVRSFVCRMLPPQGFEVISADSPVAALQVAKEFAEPIGLLLTDVVMPGLNGRELYQKLLALRPGLRVLYMSGYPADVIASHGVLDPGVHFITKPFPISDLVAAIRTALAE